jgi:hypothetical protein
MWHKKNILSILLDINPILFISFVIVVLLSLTNLYNVASYDCLD